MKEVLVADTCHSVFKQNIQTSGVFRLLKGSWNESLSSVWKQEAIMNWQAVSRTGEGRSSRFWLC